MSNKVDLARLFAEDGGERYIVSRYPDSRESFKNTHRKFSIRKENTPSASVKKMKSGEWGVTDFGGDSKWRNAIHIAMLEDGIEYGPALGDVCQFYNYQDDARNYAPKPRYEQRPAGPSDQEGHIDVVPREITVAELRTVLTDSAWANLGSSDEIRAQKGRQIFAMYHCKALESYSTVYKGKHLTTYSTDEYPIFYFDEGTFGKIYRPKAPHAKRFRYVGSKPKHFIHGLQQAQEFVAQCKKEKYEAEAAKAAAAEFQESDKEKAKEVERQEVKLPEIIQCSGGSDALNVAALGYRVIWLNSETETLRGDDYGTLMKLTYKLYNLPDIDQTGKTSAHALAGKYINLLTIWLPDKILKFDAETGKAVSKDLRDYLRFPHKKKDFDRLVATAMPYRFWDMERTLDDDGNPKYKFGRPIVQYKFNHVQAYNFLYRSGFARFKSERDKDGYFYVQITGNVVRKVDPQEVKNYLHFFLEERAQFDPEITLDLRNSMYTTNQLSVSNLANLPLVELDFVATGPDHQYLFFPNCTWKITPGAIEESKGLNTSKYVWEDKVISYPAKDKHHQPRIKRKDPMLRIGRRGEGDYDIEILDDSCMFLRFLINTARVHWRKELEERQMLWMTHDKPAKREEYVEEHGLTQEEEGLFFAKRSQQEQDAYLAAHRFDLAGPLLTDAERQEQRMHLVNRIYTLGYMMHRYKDPSRAWAVWAMDNKLSDMSDDSKSNGGSGKSLTGKALKWIWRYSVSFSGRNPNLTKNPHIYDKVTRQTDMIIVDDCFEYLDFGFFYGDITGDMNPNPKQTQSYTIPFDESPKFWFDSNFGDRDFSESTQRRKLVTSFSDYYHENNGNYRETRQPTDDFGGRRLFYDFTPEDWNRFYNLLGECLAFYLAATEKVKPPMNNIQKRNLLSSMGGRFFEWAELYFDPESGRLNVFVSKADAKQEYMDSEKIRDLSTQKFSDYLRKYADYHGYELNPEEYQNGQGRIIREHDGKRQELIYFKTRRPEILTGPDQSEGLAPMPPGEMPF
ncbi:hypothetical protein [Persicitalea jodogahamensis]|uniref:Uncharacterized protein n=1 Tax=Persicitalea jodogahamensis TaxID=402147 RepID=A0A8J3G8C4_9BACT|nr:hypothetical protein [Persicitalea jodogahamensis]GHB63931.1 hypothetical protein GCM10007390_17230 [Persicitalea jodogahamensis]